MGNLIVSEKELAYPCIELFSYYSVLFYHRPLGISLEVAIAVKTLSDIVDYYTFIRGLR